MTKILLVRSTSIDTFYQYLQLYINIIYIITPNGQYPITYPSVSIGDNTTASKMQKIINQSMTLHKSLILATTQDMRMHSLLVPRIKDRVMMGDIQLQDLVASKVLGQELDKYKSLLPHVSATIQLANEWKSTVAGVDIEYIFTDARHTNPLCKVTLQSFIKRGHPKFQIQLHHI